MPSSSSIEKLPNELWVSIIESLWSTPSLIAQTMCTWSAVNKRHRQLTISETTWRRRTEALLALLPAVRLPCPSPLTMYSSFISAVEEKNRQRSLHDNNDEPSGTLFYVDWRFCFLHCYYAVVSQKCILCSSAPLAFNSPFSVLRPVGPTEQQESHNLSNNNDNNNAEQSKDELTSESLADFPFLHCSICTICLRRYFYLASQRGEGRVEWTKKERRFFKAHGRWRVCLRRDAFDIAEELGQQEGEGVESNNLQNRSHVSSGGGGGGQPPAKRCRSSPTSAVLINTAEQYEEETSSGSDVAAMSTFAVRLFISRSMLAESERYLSPAHRSHERPADPMDFLRWPGHVLRQ